MGKTINDWRKEIDFLDDELLQVVARRIAVVKEIGKIKKEKDIEPLDKKRWQEVLTTRLAKAKQLKLSQKIIEEIFDRVHNYALKVEQQYITKDLSETTSLLNSVSIGIIGFGSFGKLFYDAILPKKNIQIFSPHASQKAENRTLPFVEKLEELVKKSHVVIPIVPINQFENVIKTISPLLKDNALIIDVCSVKEYPVHVMQRYLPKHIQWITTHPMFGPKTFKEQHESLEEMKIVLCTDSKCEPKIYGEIKKYFHHVGLDVIEMSAQDHDKMAARSHFFVKSMNIVAEKLKLQSSPVDTIPAGEIFSAFKKMGVDEEIVTDMLTYNPYCKEILKSMIEELKKLALSK